jgi:hypothetical protein
MTRSALVILMALASGCGHGDDVQPDAATTTINITTDVAPALVAFRDGSGGWRPATAKTATSFAAEVASDYVVAVACDRGGLHQTSQRARAVGDSHDLMVSCALPQQPVQHTVTGHMVQAGKLHFGGSFDQSTAADWDFHVVAPTGSADLMAITATGIALRHGIAVSGDLVVTPPVDVVNEGAPLADVSFSATNALPTETLSSSIVIDTASLSKAIVYLGPPATAKIAPDAVLVPTDKQIASVFGTDGARSRALRRPFRVGDDAAFELPAPITAQFMVDQGQLGVGWSTLPAFDTFQISADNGKNFYDLDASPAFVEASGVGPVAIDTDIPGLEPSWKIDLSAPYDRSVVIQNTANDVVTFVMLFESLNGPP